ITRVVEFVMPFPVDFFAEATPADVAAEAWLVPDFVNADGHYLMRFHTRRSKSCSAAPMSPVATSSCPRTPSPPRARGSTRGYGCAAAAGLRHRSPFFLWATQRRSAFGLVSQGRRAIGPSAA
ncbi:MAG TPA: hypothetical protein VNW96_20735, partial [Mycobacterium sp.]|nr:hypothetical protein [Mycobacterium sp.]